MSEGTPLMAEPADWAMERAAELAASARQLEHFYGGSSHVQAVQDVEREIAADLRLARREGMEAAKAIAAAHDATKGSAPTGAVREGAVRAGIMKYGTDETRAEVWAEERGEKIASEIIAAAIQSLIDQDGNTAQATDKTGENV